MYLSELEETIQHKKRFVGNKKQGGTTDYYYYSLQQQYVSIV